MDRNRQSHPHQSISVIKKNNNKVGNYILGNTIGQGGFAKVKLATHIYTQQKVAIKILDKSKIIKEPSDLGRIKKEINIFKMIRHKNVIQLYEIMESASALYIVMEYCEGKELFDYIIKRKQLTEREACRFFQQIINGVEYLHMSNITHRDLKPENLLLDNKRRVKISDFGLSTYSNERANGLLQTPCGTPSYAPPEMLRGDEYNGQYSDIWSCGIILYTMLCGNLPYTESKEELIYEYLITQKIHYPRHLSPMVIDLLTELLAFNPTDRPDFAAIKRHPWFNMIKPQLKPGVIIGVHLIPIDENILNKIEQYGYDKEKCRRSIEENSFDCFSCIYYLILKEFSRDGKSSISDLYSDCYVDYFKDLSNWINPSDISNERYKDYWVDKPSTSPVKTTINVNSRNRCFSPMRNGSIGKSDIELLHNQMEYITIHTAFPKRKQIETMMVDDDHVFATEALNPETIKKKIEKLRGDNERFMKSMKDIDSYSKVNGNSILPISDKLIKGTIFGKYLVKHFQKTGLTELESKFQLMQKYKCLMEFIEMTYPGMFHRKVYDCSYSAFDSFLKEEEDFVFGRDFLKNNCNTGFLEKIKRGMRGGIHKRVNSVQNCTSRRTNNQYEFMLSADTHVYSTKKKNKKRKKNIVILSPLVQEEQLSEQSNSSSSSFNAYYNTMNEPLNKTERKTDIKSPINHTKHIYLSTLPIKDKPAQTARTTVKKTTFIKETPQKTTPIRQRILPIYPLKNKEDNTYAKVPIQTAGNTHKKQPRRTGRSVEIEELILNNDQHKKLLCNYKKTIYNDSLIKQRNLSNINNNEHTFKTLHQTMDTIDSYPNNLMIKSTIQPFNSPPCNTERSDHIDNSIRLNTLNTLQSFTEEPNEDTEANKQHINPIDSLPTYSGLIDFQCCIDLPLNQIILIIKKVLKNKSYYCKETHNKLACSKGLQLFTITLMKLQHTTSIVYLKIQSIKGERIVFQDIIKVLMKGLIK